MFVLTAGWCEERWPVAVIQASSLAEALTKVGGDLEDGLERVTIPVDQVRKLLKEKDLWKYETLNSFCFHINEVPIL